MGAAGGRPKVSDMTLKELAKPCPFGRDEDLPMPSRHETMNLDNVKKEDVPPGPILLDKKSMSLITEDIELAHPVLGHPSGKTGHRVPWKYLNKPEPEYVHGSSSKAYNPPRLRGPIDLSLRTDDIDYATPAKQSSGVQAKLKRMGAAPATTPSYQFAAYDRPPPEPFRLTGRHSMDCSDIDGATAGPALPQRKIPMNPLRLEPEFQSKKHQAAVQALDESFAGSGHISPRAGFSLRNAGFDVATPRAAPPLDSEKQRVTPREGHPLEPRYHVHVAEHGTSLHMRYQTERPELGDAPPPTKVEELGFVHGSTSRAGIRDNGEPQSSLTTVDLPGARPQRRAGVLPVNMYGPMGSRPVQSSNLDTSNIAGAQADTGHSNPLRETNRRLKLSARGAQHSVPDQPAREPTPKEMTLRFSDNIDEH
eukprot:CAMPEP_0197657974 /NCGR_PEP_ID=MMETSP1338-20131121/44957_1 /TAXON_ID=43686 ORGANISM="Pelagodinium beii, Strain RCC1491" /NCGR_SAMPLE_ID=MMETSP1338 /ASSEMBLY_ACC=CAM_ASM_000754 /LENGTH=421 /DNA_ID=CAMNT_0043234467 /DNA_START=110 /DNA_END=1375 /DNA_ORIENTATION=+